MTSNKCDNAHKVVRKNVKMSEYSLKTAQIHLNMKKRGEYANNSNHERK